MLLIAYYVAFMIAGDLSYYLVCLQVTRHLSMAVFWGEATPMPPRWSGS